MFLSWLFYYITLYPDIQEKVANELIEKLNGRPISEEIIKKLTYTTQVLNECLRHSIQATFSVRINEEKEICPLVDMLFQLNSNHNVTWNISEEH